MMTPDRRSCRGVMPRRDPCKFRRERKTMVVVCNIFDALVHYFVVCTGGRNIAEVSLHCNWWSARLDRALWGRLVGREQDGYSLPLLNTRREHYGVRHHWVHHDLPRPARRCQSGFAISCSRRLYRRLQHLLHLPVGDASRSSRRLFRSRCSLLSGQLRGRPSCSVGWVSAR